MANLGDTFDPSTISASSYDPLPVGEYRAEIIASEVKPTKNGLGQYLQIEMQILDGEYASRHVWDRLNLWNQNAQTVEIAQRTLKQLCDAVGSGPITDSEELHQRPFVLKVRMTANKQTGEMQNAFNYKAEGDAQPARPAAPTARPAAPTARPVSPPQAAAPKAAGKPWERAKRTA
jgi:hypothetical protein